MIIGNLNFSYTLTIAIVIEILLLSVNSMGIDSILVFIVFISTDKQLLKNT